MANEFIIIMFVFKEFMFSLFIYLYTYINQLYDTFLFSNSLKHTITSSYTLSYVYNLVDDDCEITDNNELFLDEFD